MIGTCEWCSRPVHDGQEHESGNGGNGVMHTKCPTGPDYMVWDQEAEAIGPDAVEVLGPRPFGPSKVASRFCKSGRRPYCTCDTCF